MDNREQNASIVAIMVFPSSIRLSLIWARLRNHSVFENTTHLKNTWPSSIPLQLRDAQHFCRLRKVEIRKRRAMRPHAKTRWEHNCFSVPSCDILWPRARIGLLHLLYVSPSILGVMTGYLGWRRNCDNSHHLSSLSTYMWSISFQTAGASVVELEERTVISIIQRVYVLDVQKSLHDRRIGTTRGRREATALTCRIDEFTLATR